MLGQKLHLLTYLGLYGGQKSWVGGRMGVCSQKSLKDAPMSFLALRQCQRQCKHMLF